MTVRICCDFPGCMANGEKPIRWMERWMFLILAIPIAGNLAALMLGTVNPVAGTEAHLCPEHYAAIFKKEGDAT